jgi:hypothetical protein
VPITKEVRAVIGARADGSGPFVFSTDGGKHPFSGYSKAKKALDEKIAALRAADGREPMPAWDHHDLRRTARSLMSRADVDGEIAERVLGHLPPGVRSVYDRWQYLEEKRDALEKLAAMVERILKPPAGNVAVLTDRLPRSARRR